MVEWITNAGLTQYQDAVASMEAHIAAMIAGEAKERVWLVEHPPLYTAGTSAKPADLLNPDFEIHQTRRGGEYTYHGPGQRVAYVMLDLNKRGRDVRQFVAQLEDWIIATLASFHIPAFRRAGRVGVWVMRPDKPPLPDGTPAEDKIAAIGVRLRKWRSYHGISINVEPDLSHYRGIVPCGISQYGVTSLIDLGLPLTMDDLDLALKLNFERIFANS